MDENSGAGHIEVRLCPPELAVRIIARTKTPHPIERHDRLTATIKAKSSWTFRGCLGTNQGERVKAKQKSKKPNITQISKENQNWPLAFEASHTTHRLTRVLEYSGWASYHRYSHAFFDSRLANNPNIRGRAKLKCLSNPFLIELCKRKINSRCE